MRWKTWAGSARRATHHFSCSGPAGGDADTGLEGIDDFDAFSRCVGLCHRSDQQFAYRTGIRGRLVKAPGHRGQGGNRSEEKTRPA